MSTHLIELLRVLPAGCAGAHTRNNKGGMMKTTLNAIRACNPCIGGWKKLLRYVGKTEADDEPLSIATVVYSNGIDDALWATRAVKDCDRELRLYAVWCARQVQHLMPDERSIAALDVAERHANGAATDKELAAASDAARAAAWAAARAAARAAASDAASATAMAAAWDAAWAAASATARAAAWAAARAAASDAQTDELLRVCACVDRGEDPYPAGTCLPKMGVL